MSSVELLPNGTSSNNGNNVGGAASVHAALADSSTGTYIEYDYTESSTLVFDDSAVPAGSAITSLVLHAQVAKVATSCKLQFRFGMNGQLDSAERTFNFSTPTTITVPFTLDVGTLDADVDALEVRVENRASDARLYRLAAVVTYSVIPTVTVTAPTGTISDRNIVTVGWTPTFDGTVSSSGYEVKIFNDATYLAGGFDPSTSTPTLQASASGEFTPSTSHAFTEPLPDDTYRAYVRVTHVAENGATLTSAWDYEGFVVSVNYPANPTLTLTPDDALGRIEIDLDDNAGAATTDYFEIERTTDEGATWTGVRTDRADGWLVPTAGLATVFDYEAPNGTSATYRARAIHDYGSGNTAASSWVEATSMWSSSQWWIKHPTRPDLNLDVTLRSHADRRRAARQGVMQPIGATYPTVVSDTRGAATGSITFLMQTTAEKDSFDALLDAGVPLLLQGPPDNYEADRWVVFGDHDRVRLVDKGWFETTDDTLPWTEVRRPSDDALDSAGLFPASQLLESLIS